MARINQAMQDLFRYGASILPQKRSTFDKSHSNTTTMDSAYLVPLMYDRVVPGDEKQIRVSALARMATPLHPVMDQANFDIWAFYVPDRLWWSNAKKFYGENLDPDFVEDPNLVMPYLVPSQYSVDPSYVVINDGEPVLDGGQPVWNDPDRAIGSLNDYFGFPIMRTDLGDLNNRENLRKLDQVIDFHVSAGLHRSYQLIWNEWFRNSSIQPALQLNTGDTVTDEEWDVIKKIRKVNKYSDFYTSLLRSPQAGPDVTIALGEWAPVKARMGEPVYDLDDDLSTDQYASGLEFYTVDSNIGYGVLGTPDSSALIGVNDAAYAVMSANTSTNDTLGITPANLWADLTNASNATINNLRAAITIQQLMEIQNLAGKRYQQQMQAIWGVFIPDATLQRPELLGASRSIVGMRQVLQTSATDPESNLTPQGNTAAFSVTNVSNEWLANKSFTEPGFIIIVGAVRVAQSYSQGLDPLLTQLTRYEQYHPVFDNLGNQPVPTSDIYFSWNYDNESDDYNPANVEARIADMQRTFGYKEAWTEYRTRQNRVCGLMRPDLTGGNQPGSLASWNYAVNFKRPPLLNSAFIEEDPELLDRTIAVQTEPQFLVDVYFDYKDTKSMSVHSVPGLMRL